MDKDFMEKVCRKLAEWETSFYAQSLNRKKSAVQKDVAFVRKCVAAMPLGSYTEETFNRIEKFLALQLSETLGAFSITFHGCECANETIRVDDVAFFDFAGAWLMNEYTRVSVKNDAVSSWTAKQVDEILQLVRKDFAYDGYVVKVNLIGGVKGQPKGSEINMKIRVTDWTTGIFRIQTALEHLQLL